MWLEAVSDARTHVVVMLAAIRGINRVVGLSRVEIAHFEPRPPPMPKPHVQSSADLQYPCIGAGLARVRAVEIAQGSFPEAAITAAQANPWRDGIPGKNVHSRRWRHKQRSDVFGNLVLV